jgi:hypothetical protein
MQTEKRQAMLVIPMEEWTQFQERQQQILDQLKTMQQVKGVVLKPASPNITAKEFMAAVRLCRSNFDKLVHRGKIMTLKKVRKYMWWPVRWKGISGKWKCRAI